MYFRTLFDGNPEDSKAFSTFFLSSLFCANVFRILKWTKDIMYKNEFLEIHVLVWDIEYLYRNKTLNRKTFITPIIYHKTQNLVPINAETLKTTTNPKLMVRPSHWQVFILKFIILVAILSNYYNIYIYL